jgi:hypothetical protein
MSQRRCHIEHVQSVSALRRELHKVLSHLKEFELTPQAFKFQESSSLGAHCGLNQASTLNSLAWYVLYNYNSVLPEHVIDSFKRLRKL